VIEININNKENEICRNLGEKAIHLLNKTIIDISNCSDDDLVYELVHIQIVIELMLKYYISVFYGFDNILNKKHKNIKDHDPVAYLNNLNCTTIHTLGYMELVVFLEEKKDFFGYVVKDGVIPFYVAEYDYLHDTFRKFQDIRNNYVHLGIDLGIIEHKWIRDEYYEVVLVFLSSIMRKIDERNGIDRLILFDNNDLDDTPVDVLKRCLTNAAFNSIRSKSYIIDRLVEIAEDASDMMGSYKCRGCSEETLVLNILDSEGISKCFYCGDFFQAAYTHCAICNSTGTVTFDDLNIGCNGNVMSGYCYECETRVKVYKCPICGNIYTYSRDGVIEGYIDDCCLESFLDRDVS